MPEEAPKLDSPTVRLAHSHGAQGDNVLIGQRGAERLPRESAPALLISYVYLKSWEENKHRYMYRDWVMDSGAFSAHFSGTSIDLPDYINVCKRLMDTDPTLTEIFALDVIGDWKAGLRNIEQMWKAGVPAIPCYHIDEPSHVLKTLAATYPKIALGGVAMLRGGKKLAWAEQCFNRVWPCRIHGFGFGNEKAPMSLPFHSVDATSWEVGPCKFGRWNSYGQMSVRGSCQNLRAEVEWYLALERKCRARWSREMATLAKRSWIGPHGLSMKRDGGLKEDNSAAIRLSAQISTGRWDKTGFVLPDESPPGES